MRGLGVNPAKVFRMLDQDQSGNIDQEEFLRANKSLPELATVAEEDPIHVRTDSGTGWRFYW